MAILMVMEEEEAGVVAVAAVPRKVHAVVDMVVMAIHPSSMKPCAKYARNQGIAPTRVGGVMWTMKKKKKTTPTREK
jgi:hypothetical protein